jgi:hypothetical protein
MIDSLARVMRASCDPSIQKKTQIGILLQGRTIPRRELFEAKLIETFVVI